VLELVQAEDAADRASGKKLRDIKKEAVVRLCEQVYRAHLLINSRDFMTIMMLGF
jgi:hypothetical protein